MARSFFSEKETYNRYYGDFRGVDFSSDHTQVNEHRLAFAVNMFRDYQSSQGQALETIAGFRRRVVLPNEDVVYGIYNYSHKDGNGVTQTKVLIHAGTKLYLWHNYPNSINVTMTAQLVVPAPTTEINNIRTFEHTLSDLYADVEKVTLANGEEIPFTYDKTAHKLSYASSALVEGNTISIKYKEGLLIEKDAIYDRMNPHKSTSFIINNLLYLMDGKNYLVYDGYTIANVLDKAYAPLTYINIIPAGANADIGTEYEQRNMLQPNFRHTFIADGETKEFFLNENNLDAIVEVKVYGTVLSDSEYTINLVKGTVTFNEAPAKPETVEQEISTEEDKIYYPEFYAGIEITAKKIYSSVEGVAERCDNVSDLITHCTIATIYDNRVFLSGNPDYPNHIFYCARNSTGFVDPSYFGVLNYQQDGVGIAPITGMITVADTLMVLKNDTQQDGSTYFHTPLETNNNLQPKLYPSTQGLSGIGCLGACVNFLDDPIFISRLGVEAVGQLSVRYERANEHRSTLIDAKLVNMDLSHAMVCEWNGYLLVLVDGNMFMADSRQKYTHEIGVPQYEWYYIEGIGVYKGQYPEYLYAKKIAAELEGKTVHFCNHCHKGENACTCGEEADIVEIPIVLANAVYTAPNEPQSVDWTGNVVNGPDGDGNATVEVFDEGVEIEIDGVSYIIGVMFTPYPVYDKISGEQTGYVAHLCESKGNYTGGVFKKATIICNMFDNIFFGTENGVVCSFNFDKRTEMGEIDSQWYSFDDRTINCGCATKMDCCGVPHLTKTTVKKSTVIKTKSFRNSAAKIKVRTNKKPYTQLGRINNSLFTFDDMDFDDFTFSTTEQSLFAVREKEKKWVEKQYYIYSDEFCKPFALFYISFRYQVIGRYKG